MGNWATGYGTRTYQVKDYGAETTPAPAPATTPSGPPKVPGHTYQQDPRTGQWELIPDGYVYHQASGQWLHPQHPWLQAPAAGGNQYVNIDAINADVARNTARPDYWTRAGAAQAMGRDPITGAPTLARDQFEAQYLGAAWQNDRRYQAAIAGAAQQRMAAAERENASGDAVTNQWVRAHAAAYAGRPDAQAAMARDMAADPAYHAAMQAARINARGGVTQGAQRSAGLLDNPNPTYGSTLDYMYGDYGAGSGGYRDPNGNIVGARAAMPGYGAVLAPPNPWDTWTGPGGPGMPEKPPLPDYGYPAKPPLPPPGYGGGGYRGVGTRPMMFDEGGVVPGIPGTHVPALLQPGETVLPRGAGQFRPMRPYGVPDDWIWDDLRQQWVPPSASWKSGVGVDAWQPGMGGRGGFHSGGEASYSNSGNRSTGSPGGF